jgi:choline dehydrogenase-like flavoprotein
MPGNTPSADVIVVGAGSSGAVVAGRLAESGMSVLLVEAGPDWRSESCPPSLRFPRPDVFAWKVGGAPPDGFIWPDVFASRRPGRAAELYVRGRGLGGTSAINGLVVIRPPLEEFDEWAAAGCTGWGAADVLPAFVRSENDLDYSDAPYHGRNGPTPIVRREQHDWGTTDHLLAEGATAMGHGWEPDHNAPGVFGVSRTALNIRMGVRVTTNDGYIEPFRSSGRLRVLCNALVGRVLFDGSTARGVMASTPEGDVELRADRVVLAGGTVASPAILQRSGLGPSHVLSQLQIPIIAELPVGAGVQDHVGFWLSLDLANGAPAVNGARGNTTLRYTSGVEGGGSGDLLMVAANPLESDTRTGGIGVKLAQCHSRGELRIVSPDAQAAPQIQMNLLVDERDRVLGRRAFRDAVSLLQSRPLRKNVLAVRDRHGRELEGNMKDEHVDAWLDSVATDTSHLSSGARMGSADSPGTVVNPQCEVLGVDGVWVADMSITPWVPRANTHLTAIMIGERVAEFIAARR